MRSMSDDRFYGRPLHIMWGQDPDQFEDVAEWGKFDNTFFKNVDTQRDESELYALFAVHGKIQSFKVRVYCLTHERVTLLRHVDRIRQLPSLQRFRLL